MALILNACFIIKLVAGQNANLKQFFFRCRFCICSFVRSICFVSFFSALFCFSKKKMKKKRERRKENPSNVIAQVDDGIDDVRWIFIDIYSVLSDLRKCDALSFRNCLLNFRLICLIFGHFVRRKATCSNKRRIKKFFL